MLPATLTPRLFRWSLGIAVLMAGILVASHSLAATGTMPLTGYAWSSVMGWIDFNGTGYGVLENKSSGALSGYAWSSNFGWVSFEASDATHSAPIVDLNIGQISGWARACAAFADKNACSGALDANSSGWDGWIALSGIAGDGTSYGVVQNRNCTLTGYAWGSDAIGAISVSGIAVDGSAYSVTGTDQNVCAGINPTCPNGYAYIDSSCVACSNEGCSGTGGTPSNPTGSLVCNNDANNPPSCSTFGPTATLSVDPSVIDQGQSSTLTWSSTKATSCTAAGGFSTGGATSGSFQLGTTTPPGITSYQIVCEGPSGTSTPAFASVEVLAPTVIISANPQRVKKGTNSQISWSASGVTSCTVTDASGRKLATGNADNSNNFSENSPYVATITTQTTFTIVCKTHGKDVTRSVLVNVPQDYQEF